MTVSTTTSKSGPYAGAGMTGPFLVDFRFLENSHLRVIKTSDDGVDATISLGTDYIVSGAGDGSGVVTLLVGLLEGEKLTIVRDVPATQEADYVQNDAFPAESHEEALDKLTMLAQQLAEQNSRSIKVGISDPTPADEYRDNLLQRALDAETAAGAALASENAAAASEQSAGESAASALTNKNATDVNAASALVSKNAAAVSEGNAGGSAASALANREATDASAAEALASKNAAAVSEGNAANSETNALAYKNQAEAAADAAANHDPYLSANVNYDNTVSGLEAEDVQAAIDETVAAFKALDDQLGFAIVPINSGNNIAVASTYVVDNPFPGHSVFTEVQLFVSGKWVRSWSQSSGASYYGTNGGVAGDEIRVASQTLGVAYFAAGGLQTVTAYAGTAGIVPPCPCRVLVWKLKGAI